MPNFTSKRVDECTLSPTARVSFFLSIQRFYPYGCYFCTFWYKLSRHHWLKSNLSFSWFKMLSLSDICLEYLHMVWAFNFPTCSLFILVSSSTSLKSSSSDNIPHLLPVKSSLGTQVYRINFACSNHLQCNLANASKHSQLKISSLPMCYSSPQSSLFWVNQSSRTGCTFNLGRSVCLLACF